MVIQIWKKKKMFGNWSRDWIDRSAKNQISQHIPLPSTNILKSKAIPSKHSMI